MAYADYEYYRTVYMGDILEETEFPRVAERASEYIDYITFNRASSLQYAGLPQVKKCCCALAECYQVIENAKVAVLSNDDEAMIKSETVDGWTQSRMTSFDIDQELQEKLKSIAGKYLTHTGLLYRGRLCTCP